MPGQSNAAGAAVHNGVSSATIDALSEGAKKHAQWALLNELVDLLEETTGCMIDLRDLGLDQWPLAADARSMMKMIASTVEALDALGWQEIINWGPEEKRSLRQNGDDR
jgi:hypothetical protein